MYNMNGEFRKHHQMDLEAGHVMMLVGYNDEFETEDGMVGGLIVRNTWMDGVYSFDEFGELKSRGSHSLPYFMQTISASDERLLCPNSYDPRNWYPCGSTATDVPSLMTACLATAPNITSNAQIQPYHLLCRNSSYCSTAPNDYYILLNSTKYQDDLTIMCFLQYNSVTLNGDVVCGNPQPIESYTVYFAPITSEIRNNTDDWCGFYILPYDLIRQSNAIFNGFFVNDYHFTFSQSSYFKNADSTLDYKYVQASTATQKTWPVFDTPYPNTLN